MTKSLSKSFYVLALIAMFALPVFFFSACGEISVEKVELDVTTKTIDTGSTFKLNATITPNDATNTKLLWSSSNSDVASVDDEGKVTGLTAGTTVITVKTEDGGKTATCSVTVVPAVVNVESVSLNETTKELIKGESFTLVATVNPSNATNKNVSWSTSNASVVTVNNGVIYAVGTGTATIKVTTENGSKIAECTVTVPVVEATSITLSGNELSNGMITMRNDDQPITLTATVAPANTTQTDLVWTSSNENIATVNNGVITPVAGAKGSTVISVKCAENEAVMATCTVYVTRHIESVAFSQTSLYLLTEDTKDLSTMVVFTPLEPSITDVTFTSSNTEVVSVNGSTITAVGVGTSTIMVTTKDGSKTAELYVTVNQKVTSVSLNLTEMELTTSSIKLVATPNAVSPIVWESSNPDVVRVDESGLVYRMGTGNAVITAKATNSHGVEATCQVTARDAYAVIEGNDTEYTTFEQALAAAVSGNTIVLHGNMTAQANNIQINNKNLTIKGFVYAGVQQDPITLQAKGTMVDSVANFIRIDNNSNVTFQDLILDGNGDLANVRVLRVAGSNLVLQNATIQNGKYNTTKENTFGSGLMLTGTSTATIKNSNIRSNVFTSTDETLLTNDRIYSQDLWMGSQTSVTIEDSTIGYAYKNANEYSIEGGSFVTVKGDSVIANLYLEYDTRTEVNGKPVTVPAAQCKFYAGRIVKLYLGATTENTEPTLIQEPVSGKLYVAGQEATDLPQE